MSAQPVQSLGNRQFMRIQRQTWMGDDDFEARQRFERDADIFGRKGGSEFPRQHRTQFNHDLRADDDGVLAGQVA